MKFYSKNITADSLTGAVFALEGIKNTVVIMNSPTGCKFYHSSISDYQYTRSMEFDPLNYPQNFYFGQPRVPCTYLDSYDYVYGSKSKLDALLDFVSNKDYDLIVIINSPGASLIGDNLEGIASTKIKDKPFLIIETPGFSDNFYNGFQNSIIALLKQMNIQSSNINKENTVNLIGISIYNKYYKGDIQEIKRLLSLCGIHVNCVLCADTEISEIKNLPDASLNIVLYPELGNQIAKYLEEKYDIPYFLFNEGLPIGFDLTEKFIRSICKILDKDCTTFIIELEKARAQAYIHISRINSLTGLPKGVTFSIESTSSSLYAYTNFFLYYFGMIPNCVSFLDGDFQLYRDNLIHLFDKHHLQSAVNRNIYETESDLVFSNGNTISQLKLRNHTFSGIEIDLPTLGYIDVIPKTHLGISGSLMLVEQIINGMIFK